MDSKIISFDIEKTIEIKAPCYVCYSCEGCMPILKCQLGIYPNEYARGLSPTDLKCPREVSDCIWHLDNYGTYVKDENTDDFEWNAPSTPDPEEEE